MPNEKLNDYIKKCIELGKQEEEITSNLLSVGWAKEDIEEAFLNTRPEEGTPVTDVAGEDVNEFSNSLNDKINSIQEESDVLEEKKEDVFLEPIEEEKEEEKEEESSFVEPIEEVAQEETQEKDKFVDNPKQINSKKIIIPIVVVLLVALIFGTVFSFVQKIGPFSFLKEVPEVITPVDLPQEEVIVEEPIVGWFCGDELIDDRDGNIYSTILIGSQCWIGKNLNYAIGNSSCYNDDAENCELNGRLYDWNTAVSACPLGWSLPTDADFQMLERYLGMEEEEIETTGWRGVSPNAQGTIDLLNISLSGVRDISGQFKYLGEYANFWLSDSVDELYSARAFRTKDSNIYKGNVSGEYGYSVRCIRY